MFRTALAFASLCMMMAATAALAGGVDVPDRNDPWRIVLGQQLKDEKNCHLNEVLMYNEIPLGDEIAIDGRASCIDGREFNFSRKRPHQKFTVELCEPTVC